jgi:Ca2+-binding EF-hand superfamily protein
MSNVQQSNPTLFKKINDRALAEDHQGRLDKNEFIKLFLNQDLLKRDIAKADRQQCQPPDVIEIAELFEFLDEDRNGMIEAKDLMSALEISQRLKMAAFDIEKYSKGQTNTPPELERTLSLMRKEVQELIQSFDLTGDGMLGPEEFFNIIMYAYDA